MKTQNSAVRELSVSRGEVPSLASRAPELLAALLAEIECAPHGELPAIHGELARLDAHLLLRLSMPAATPLPEEETTSPEVDPAGDRLLTVEEAAAILGQKPQWVRAHQNELPRVMLPGRNVRFSAKRLESWIRRRSM
jgi:excisionase family DNA binding protein